MVVYPRVYIAPRMPPRWVWEGYIAQYASLVGMGGIHYLVYMPLYTPWVYHTLYIPGLMYVGAARGVP